MVLEIGCSQIPARCLSLWHEQRTGQSVKDWIAEQESALQSNKQ